MNEQLLGAFFLVSLALVFTPGADWAYIFSHSRSRRDALLAVAGLLLGHLGHTLLAAAGLSLALSLIPGALSVLTLIGAGYLLWLGIATLRNLPSGLPGPAVTDPDAEALARPSMRSVLTRGFGTSGLNPKVILVYVSLIPQFISASAPWPVGVQAATLGVIMLVNTALIYSALALFSVRVLAARPRVFRRVSLASGTLMILIATVLAGEQVIVALA